MVYAVCNSASRTCAPPVSRHGLPADSTDHGVVKSCLGKGCAQTKADSVNCCYVKCMYPGRYRERGGRIGLEPLRLPVKSAQARRGRHTMY